MNIQTGNLKRDVVISLVAIVIALFIAIAVVPAT